MGQKHSEETRRKISENNGHKGRERTKEHSAAISAGRKTGKKREWSRVSDGEDSFWSAEEIEMLMSLVEENGPEDWEDKAEALGTNRTATAVQTKYGIEARERKLTSSWSQEELDKLAELVQKEGFGEWDAKAKFLQQFFDRPKCRTGKAVQMRYERLVGLKL